VSRLDIDRVRGDIRGTFEETCSACGGGGGGEHYLDRTDGPVRYVVIAAGSRLSDVVGYLWASEDDRSAGFVPKLYSRHPGYASWRRLLSIDRANGLAPLEMLRSRQGGSAAHAAESLYRVEELATRPATYTPSCATPIRYLRVHKGNHVIGFLWASDVEGAAGFIPRSLRGSEARQAEPCWRERLEDAYQAGLSPMDAIREWIGGPAHPLGGGVPADADEQVARHTGSLISAANTGRL
jgi:hypothetical protein